MSATLWSECPSCGTAAARDVYDIGDGPEVCCVDCEWCWGANGQPLTARTIDPALIAAQIERERKR